MSLPRVNEPFSTPTSCVSRCVGAPSDGARWFKEEVQPHESALKSPKAVLFAIARNVVFDLGRRRAVVEIKSVAEIERLSVLDEQASVPETVSTRQELEILANALRDLPDGCRQVLTLCKMY